MRIRTIAQYLVLLILFLAPALACNKSNVPTDVIAPDDLSGMNFRYESLYGMDLSEKNLQNADFTGADLREANFSGADLTGAVLDMADLRGANFTDAKLDDKWQQIIDLLVTGDGANKDYSHLDMTDAELMHVNLSGANLAYANLDRSNLFGANMIGSDLSRASMVGTGGDFTQLNDADMTETDIRGSFFYQATLTGAIVTFEQLKTAKFSKSQI